MGLQPHAGLTSLRPTLGLEGGADMKLIIDVPLMSDDDLKEIQDSYSKYIEWQPEIILATNGLIKSLYRPGRKARISSIKRKEHKIHKASPPQTPAPEPQPRYSGHSYGYVRTGVPSGSYRGGGSDSAGRAGNDIAEKIKSSPAPGTGGGTNQ